jgi:uroporphyrinogen decarboxylase
MSVYVTEDHLEIGRRLVAEAHANGGLAPVDLDAFWRDDDAARRDPWADNCPQVPLGMRMSAECAFAELGIAEDWYRFAHDTAWRAELCRRVNDKAEGIVGRRVLDETPPKPPDRRWPKVKELHDIFEARNVWHTSSYWIEQAVSTPDELQALLERVEERLGRLRDFMLPEDWDKEKKRLNDFGEVLPIYRGQRGPVTFATSVYGAENLILLTLDQPDLAARFSNLIARAILERARILDEERGWTPEKAQRGWHWADDNCCLLNPEMYERFGLPILRTVFNQYAPDAGDTRYQHSDSDMGHLLPLLSGLGLTGVNFGPNLTVRQIRDAMPATRIDGQLAPFTLSRNEEVNIVAEAVRDCEMARERKGLVLTTAGSINAGTRLTGMRLLMAAIQRHGRY